jgi:peroxiredoxin family protein
LCTIPHALCAAGIKADHPEAKGNFVETFQMTDANEARALGILLISGTHERAHYAFALAAGAASLGRRVVIFATNAGCRAMCADWSGVDDVGRDAVIRRRGLAGLGEIREAARDVGVRMIACEAGLKAEGIEALSLWQDVEVGGIATFLEAAAAGQLISL